MKNQLSLFVATFATLFVAPFGEAIKQTRNKIGFTQMKKIRTLCAMLFVLATITGCTSQQYMSTIEGGEYDVNKDATDYFVLPLGQISLPGKWEKYGYNKEAHQQFFKNQDSVIVSASFSPTSRYEFNKNGTLKGLDFLLAFYEWESEYFKSKGFECQMIETNDDSQYILYRIYGDTADTYFLVGIKGDGNVTNLSVNITDKWTKEEKILFLKNLFLAK